MIESIMMFSRSTPHHGTGGMETLAWGLATEWARAGGNVRFVTTAVSSADAPFFDEGVEVVPLPKAPPGRYSAAWWTESRKYWQALRTPPAVVLSVSAGAYGIVQDRSRHPGSAFVMQAHGTSVIEIRSKLRARAPKHLASATKNVAWLLRDLVRYRHFDRVVAVGENVFDSLVAKPQSWSVKRDRIRLIRNGIRTSDHRFDPYARKQIRDVFGIADHVTVVGCVGRLHVQKRVDRALRAAAALRDRGCGEQFRFLLVGDGPDEARLRCLVGTLKLDDMVSFVGKVHPTRVRDYYSAADVSLLTTAHREAGLPLTVIEALACGLPCVVPDTLLRPAAFGPALAWADVVSPTSLADVLLDVAQRGRARKTLLPADFTLEQCARTYLVVFEQLVSARGSRG